MDMLWYQYGIQSVATRGVDVDMVIKVMETEGTM